MRAARAAAVLVVLLVAARAEAAISLAVVTSRTSCTAPCAVFFTTIATTGLSNSNDYVNAHWSWDFDSTVQHAGELHRNTVGSVVAHVYDNPGSYTVAMSVKDTSGATASTTIGITVSAMSGTSFYASSSGSGTTCSIPSPCSYATAMTHLTTNNSVLLRNGDTFAVTSTQSWTSITGPALIGGYSDPGSPSAVAPIISSNVTYASGNYTAVVDSSTDLRIQGVHIVSSAHAQLGFSVIGTTDMLFERLEQEGIGSNGSDGDNMLIEDISNRTFVVDSHIHDFYGLGIYGDRTHRVAVIGTTIDIYGGADHGMRFQGSNDQPGNNTGATQFTYIAEITMAPTPGGGAFDTFTMRGNDTDIVVTGCHLYATVSFVPQNSMYIESVGFALVDGNFIDTISQQTGSVSETGIDIRAAHVTVRNNIINNTTSSINVQGPTLLALGYVTEIYINNNTAYNSAASLPSGFHSNFVGRSATSGTMFTENDIVSLASTSNSSLFLETDGQGTVTSDHNLFYVSATTIASPAAGTSPVRTDPQFISIGGNDFSIPTTSPAKDAGTSVAVWTDYLGIARPQNSLWDIGAYEFYVAPSTGPAPNHSYGFGIWFALLLLVGVSLTYLAIRHGVALEAERQRERYIEAKPLVMLNEMNEGRGEPLFLPRETNKRKG